jgi:hypothetical protein
LKSSISYPLGRLDGMAYTHAKKGPPPTGPSTHHPQSNARWRGVWPSTESRILVVAFSNEELLSRHTGDCRVPLAARANQAAY